ncbi:hypothetical protein PINS_up003653 [Pythium insidiosum]|nr:hypothetical protein PINS_up003653 [Pythium insidiosum]
MTTHVPALIPPFRFSSVQHQLYRGSYPTLKNFRFLRRLQLKTIVSVIPEAPTSDLVEFCQQEKIANHHFYAEKFTSDNVTVSPATVAQILQVADQPGEPAALHPLPRRRQRHRHHHHDPAQAAELDQGRDDLRVLPLHARPRHREGRERVPLDVLRGDRRADRRPQVALERHPHPQAPDDDHPPA